MLSFPVLAAVGFGIYWLWSATRGTSVTVEAPAPVVEIPRNPKPEVADKLKLWRGWQDHVDLLHALGKPVEEIQKEADKLASAIVAKVLEVATNEA